MKRLKRTWEAWTLRLALLRYYGKWLLLGLGCDVLTPSSGNPYLPHSVTGALMRQITWTWAHRLKVPWRETEPLWRGIRAVWGGFTAMTQAREDYERLERQLRPLMERYAEPGETMAQFVNRIEQLMELAKIGEQAMREKAPPSRESGPVATAEGRMEDRAA